MTGLRRLLCPRSIAVVGGGAWCSNVLSEVNRIGFEGPVWHVHPRDGLPSVADLPEAPDAVFVGVNRAATIEVVRALANRGAGGAICFASGFAEAQAELDDAQDLQSRLLVAAGDMPILGPNCYGLINYLDRVALWPDQHGGEVVESGVAIVTQSSNIALNLTMQSRGLPIASVVTMGNQAQQGFGEIGTALLEDPRVTALGLHVEGVGNPRAFEALAATAERLGKSVVVLKIGRSEQAREAVVSHTASLVGSQSGAEAFFRRLGFAQLRVPEAFLEALKIAHLHGRLHSSRVASMSCSGGEASLMADIGQAEGVDFPSLEPTQIAALRGVLGPKVALANPLDYHTYIWGDEDAMAETFCAMMTPDHALGLLVLDLPRADRCDTTDWDPCLRALYRAQESSGVPMAVLSSLPESLPETLAQKLMAQGILPLNGLSAALGAIAAMAGLERTDAPALPPRKTRAPGLIDEAAAKRLLAEAGVVVPQGRVTRREDAAKDATALGYPVALKTLGLAHKTEAGGVVLGISTEEDMRKVLTGFGDQPLLVERMAPGAVVELLVGVVNDPAHGLVLALGRGGVETEIHADVTHALLPVEDAQISAMLGRLRCAPLLNGFRGRPAVDIEAIVRTVRAVQDFVITHPRVTEVEINPLLCFAKGAVAADALIREEP